MCCKKCLPSEAKGKGMGKIDIAETVNSDGLDLEGEEEMQSRLKVINLGPSVSADTFKKSDSSTRPLQKKLAHVEALEKFIAGGNLKQLLLNRPNPQTYETVMKNQIQLCLDYFKNVMKGGDYEFVELDSMIPKNLYVTHTNFSARLKGTDSSPELFFAELQLCPYRATHCCKLDHKLNVVGGSKTRHPDEVVLHCEHINCQGCTRFAKIDTGGELVFV
ncbi:hypothetical protein ACHQM5_022532 [Ranunculus cassubicifolius]